MQESFWNIAVDAPLFQTLTYKAPKEFQSEIQIGKLVDIPLGKRKSTGLVVESIAKDQIQNIDIIKSIYSVNESFPVLKTNFLNWVKWISNYYHYPIGEVIQLCYPPLPKADPNKKSRKKSAIPILEKKAAPDLTAEQGKILQDLKEVTGFSTHLIFGVTGSGKTEVYMRLLEKNLIEGKKGLVLVPEISLTPQLIQRFVSRFGDEVAVIHSQLTDRERTNQWWDMVEGRKRILIGARSALFCPIENLGMIIVDEEHEPSYKQEEKLKYHGRDSAIMLAKYSNCPIILGSATPSLETWKNCLEKKYVLHEMRGRVLGRQMPKIEIIDLRDDSHEVKKNSQIPFWLSSQLYSAIQENLDKNQQVALFLNRRGVAPLVICQDCGYTYDCPNCDIKLTLHGKSHLVCHYCDYHETLKDHCPDCKEGEVKPVGLGTELLESEMQRLFPNVSVARADRDEITNRLDLENLIEKMENNQIQILIGTQMIAKGLDFPNLTLVGLVLVDIGFNIPDFRSSERSFQLITQVSGRSGRGTEAGRVIVQTFNPDHPSLLFAQNYDYLGFANYELEARKQLNYPPQGKLISFRIQGVNQSKVQTVAKEAAAKARALVEKYPDYSEIEVLGPVVAPLAKVRGKFRFHFLIKGLDAKNLNKLCRHVLGDQKWYPSSVKVSVDIDPLNLL